MKCCAPQCYVIINTYINCSYFGCIDIFSPLFWYYSLYSYMCDPRQIFFVRFTSGSIVIKSKMLELNVAIWLIYDSKFDFFLFFPLFCVSAFIYKKWEIVHQKVNQKSNKNHVKWLLRQRIIILMLNRFHKQQ